MKKFLKKILYFVTTLIIILLSVSFMANGESDSFYVKFTTPPQQNLILGSSRAAQGLQPEVFKNVLGIDIFNYAFTIQYSPYGKVYYESILKKHKKVKNGVFIVTVDAWSISSYNEDPNNPDFFRENSSPLADINYVNSNPNYEYLYKYFKGRYKNIVLDDSKYLFLHNDGWLEVSGLPKDTVSYNNRINRTITPFKDRKAYLSELRLAYLIKTVKYLKDFGKVYIVRLPVQSQMAEIDNKLMPEFQNVIKEVIELSDGYYDMFPLNEKYKYNDSNHLHKDSGAKVSKKIAEWIQSLK